MTTNHCQTGCAAIHFVNLLQVLESANAFALYEVAIFGGERPNLGKRLAFV